MNTIASRLLFWSKCLLAVPVVLLSGCGSSWSAFNSSVSIQGKVYGGNQPISNSSVQVYAAGIEGFGSSAQPLLKEPIQTDASGTFSLTGLHACPSATSKIYLVAQGGSPGLPSGASNSAISLMAVLGSCQDLAASTFVTVNEVTTVGSVSPVSPYMTSVSRLGAPAADATFPQAITLVSQLIDPSRGVSPGKIMTTSASVPAAKINTLADVLAACVNTSGGVAGDGSACGALFTLATPPGGVAPTDTATAALRIAQHPSTNVTQLYALAQAATAPFQPALALMPTDWSLALVAAQASSTSSEDQTGIATSSNPITTANAQATSTSTTTTSAVAVSSSSVEVLGTIPATQPLHGLGFNLNPANDWELKMAAAAGATHARIQCGWNSTETQTAPPYNTNTSTQFALQADCLAGLKSAVSYGIHPTILAAFGSPYHAILSVTLPSGANAGATSINVQFASGVGGDTLASIKAFYDNILTSSNSYITAKHSYAGGLITGVSVIDSRHATLTLASAITSALPASTTKQYIINEGLYAPAATSGAKDPAVLAYAKYAQFLAGQIAASGNMGEVELWNEPPWINDPWDNRGMFYDAYPGTISPGPQQGGLPNFGFAAALQAQKAPTGVTFVWGGTNKSGANSLLLPRMYANTGVYATQPATVITSESFHPYGNSPEDSLWSGSCLSASVSNPSTPSSYSACNLSGNSGNIAQAMQQSLAQQRINPAFGLGHSVTETGVNVGDDAHKARFVMRQYLGYQAVGVTPVQFFKLYDTTSGYTFVNPVANADGSHSPLAALTALTGLMSDLAVIESNPVDPISRTALPSVASYSGTYPLSIVQIVGARVGDSANSTVTAVWQRSNVSGVTWSTLTQPEAAPVTFQLPIGMTVAAIRNLDTRADVSYTSSGQSVTFAVSDDPIELLLVPSAQKFLTVTVNPLSVMQGAATAAVIANVAYTGASAPTGAVHFALDGGTNVAGVCTGSTSPLACSATFSTAALTLGSHTVAVTVDGTVSPSTAVASANTAMYGTTSGSGTVTVIAAHLVFSTQPASTTVGTTFTPVIQVLDSSGNLVPNAGPVTLSFAMNPSNASLLGSTTVTPVKGVASFPGISVNASGNGFMLEASSANISNVASAAFNVAFPTMFVSAGNVVVGGSATATVFLSTPAPAAMAINLTSNHGNYVTVPSSVAVAKGLTSVTFTYYGVGAGSVAITATASGYAIPARGLAAIPATPTISPAAGAYTSGQKVTLTTATAGSVIHYTLDGTTPTAASTVYSTPLTLTAAETVKALTVANGQVSAPSSTTYTLSAATNRIVFDTQPASTTVGATFTPVPKIRIVDVSGKVVANTVSVTVSLAANPGNARLAGTTTVAAVNGVATIPGISVSAPGLGYTLTASSPGVTAAASTSFDVLTSGMCITVANVGVGTTATGIISLPSPAAAALTIFLISDQPGYVSVPATVTIAKGLSSASFSYTGRGLGLATLTASTPGYVTATRRLSGVAPSIATPAILPTSGAYASGQQVALSTSTAGATIHYTLDGTSPSATSPVYKTPLMLSSAMTVRALAIANGQTSSISMAAYTLAVAAHLVFATQPANTTIGAPMSTTVEIVGSSGAVISSASPITLSLVNAASSVTLSGVTTVAAINGVASFSGLSVGTAGSGYTLTATSPSLTSAVSGTFIISAPTSSTASSSLPGYYVSNSGSDSNAGTSANAPWKTIAKLNAAKMLAGGAAYLECGSTFRETLTLSASGVSGSPVSYGSYGTCTGTTLPVLNGADLLSTWTAEAEGSFTAYYALENVRPNIVFEDNHRLPLVSAKSSLIKGTAFYDATNKRVYVRTREDAAPETHVLEASVRTYAISGYRTSYLNVTGLEADKCSLNCVSVGGNVTNVTLNKMVTNYSHQNGIYFTANDGEYQTNILIENGTANYNGGDGVSKGNGGSNVVISNYVANYNAFDPTIAYSGGIRIVSDGSSDANRPTYSGIQNSNADFNGINPDTGAAIPNSTGSGVGVWCDTCGNGSFITNNEGHGNTQAGAQLEWTGTVGSQSMTGNRMWNNFYGVLHTRRSHNDVIANNTAWGNFINCYFTGEYGGGETTVGMIGNTYENNICSTHVSSSAGIGTLIEWGAENNSLGEGSGNVFKNNSFGVPTAANGVFVEFGAGKKMTSYAALDAAYGSSMSSMTGDPMLSNPAVGDFSLRAKSPAIGAGIGGVSLGAVPFVTP